MAKSISCALIRISISLINKAFLAELIGTILLIGSIILCFVNNVGELTPWLIGLILWFLVFVFGPISGAQYNPSVTFATSLKKWIQPRTVVHYLSAHLIAVAAIYVVFKIYLGDSTLDLNFAPFNHGLIWIVIGEFIGTFALVAVILFTIKSKSYKAFSIYGLYIGLTVSVFAFVFGKYSGGAFNPAVAYSFYLLGLYTFIQFAIAVSVQLIAAYSAYQLLRLLQKSK